VDIPIRRDAAGQPHCCRDHAYKNAHKPADQRAARGSVMTKKTSLRAPARLADARTYYAPHVLRQVQSLLSQLADLDCAFESDLATVQASNAPEVIKQEVLRPLRSAPGASHTFGSPTSGAPQPSMIRD
jgi:hypothetical protein